jgi:hypothetical protein
MNLTETCVQDRNPAFGQAPQGQRNGPGQPCPRRLHDSRVWNETKFVR